MAEFYCPNCNRYKPESQKSTRKASSHYLCLSCLQAVPNKPKKKFRKRDIPRVDNFHKAIDLGIGSKLIDPDDAMYVRQHYEE